LVNIGRALYSLAALYNNLMAGCNEQSDSKILALIRFEPGLAPDDGERKAADFTRMKYALFEMLARS